MPERSFSKPDDLVEYGHELEGIHQGRVAQLTSLLHAWESPIRMTETGRTVYINNEPWTATRLTVSLITNGRAVFKGSAPPDFGDQKERLAAIGQIERALKAHFKHIDLELYRRRRGTYMRMWAYLAAVFGWHAGINLVLDQSEKWPVFTDLWSPLETHPNMDGTGLVHITRMTGHEIERRFGKKAGINSKKSGYNFVADKEKSQDLYLVYDYWCDETNATAVIGDKGSYWIKKQIPHDLGHNPAWCNPIDAPPFTASASGRDGSLLASPDGESGRHLQFLGQSPMLGYRTAYQYLSELANQIADVVERWANPIVFAKTKDGKFVEIDLSGKVPNNVDLNTIVEIIKPPTFPNDDKAWIEFVLRDIEKASYPRAAYGSVGSTEAAYTIQLMKAASGYIIDPLIQQAEFMYEASADSILRQLEHKKKQYDRFFSVRTVNNRGRRGYDYIKLADLPDNIQMTVEIRGAGVPSDKFQALQAVTGALNVKNPALPLETMLEDYLDREDPAEDVARLVSQKLTMNDAVYEKASPIVTLVDLADRLRKKGTKRGDELADALGAMAIQAMHELQAIVKQANGAGQPAPPGAEGQAVARAAGIPEPPMGGAQGENQIEGVAPPGAPAAGVSKPPTGPAPDRGALMQAAMGAAGGSMGGPGGGMPPGLGG